MRVVNDIPATEFPHHRKYRTGPVCKLPGHLTVASSGTLPDDALVGNHHRKPTVNNHLGIQRLPHIADLLDPELERSRSRKETSGAQHIQRLRVKRIQPEVAAHFHTGLFCQCHMADISNEGLVYPISAKLFQGIKNLFRFIIGDDARQNRDRNTSSRQKRKNESQSHKQPGQRKISYMYL